METIRKLVGDAFHLGNSFIGKRNGWRDGCGIARMTSRRLDVLKDCAYDRSCTVGDAIYVKLDRVREELVD